MLKLQAVEEKTGFTPIFMHFFKEKECFETFVKKKNTFVSYIIMSELV
jgi:hypothetical protein